MESIGYVQQGDGADFECNGKNSGLDGVAFEPQKCDYSICGILNFLQSEWTKMSIERSRWEFERAELQVSRTISNWKFLDQNRCFAKRKKWMRKLEKWSCSSN